MEITVKLIVIILATFLTGLSAGLCFTWSNAVTTGLANLDDLSYLRAFQQMNRTILNPTFFLVFFGPVFLGGLGAFLTRNAHPTTFWLVLTATLLYFFGVGLVTVFGNVPLNELVDKAELAETGVEAAASLRKKFENPWNTYHYVRTYISALSFLLLLVSLIWKS
ncbi:DUF1772 domain-containing protein [Flavobacteriaceae bacterium D16]|nr:DUF1772 domain-containing protein [Flavobacteriaceae bacterium D16]